MINFLNRHSPKLAGLTDPLHQLCSLHVVFDPHEGGQRSLLSDSDENFPRRPNLPYFNSNSDTTLQTDISTRGLGAVILQCGNPIYFASRALSNAKKKYQNLEREILGTIWGLEWFYYFLYGKPFILETDQKSLVSIYRKHMVNISPWIQKLIFRRFLYQPFDVQYVPDREIPLADALSCVTPLTLREKIMEFIYLS